MLYGVPLEIFAWIYDILDNNLVIKNDFTTKIEVGLLVMFSITLFLQRFYKTRHCLKEFIKIVRLVLATVSLNRFSLHYELCLLCKISEAGGC